MKIVKPKSRVQKSSRIPNRLKEYPQVMHNISQIPKLWKFRTHSFIIAFQAYQIKSHLPPLEFKWNSPPKQSKNLGLKVQC